MNDRFKFRTYHIPTKTMEYNGQWSGKDYDKKFNDCNFIVMQCTGLKDKNGKLIYEGDVVKVNDKVTAVIEFYRGIFGCRFDSQYKFFERFLGVGAYSDFEIEVIGNIYENKELLEEECQK